MKTESVSTQSLRGGVTLDQSLASKSWESEHSGYAPFPRTPITHSR